MVAGHKHCCTKAEQLLASDSTPETLIREVQCAAFLVSVTVRSLQNSIQFSDTTPESLKTPQCDFSRICLDAEVLGGLRRAYHATGGLGRPRWKADGLGVGLGFVSFGFTY